MNFLSGFINKIGLDKMCIGRSKKLLRCQRIYRFAFRSLFLCFTEDTYCACLNNIQFCGYDAVG